jgi:hypothetical protein
LTVADIESALEGGVDVDPLTVLQAKLRTAVSKEQTSLKLVEEPDKKLLFGTFQFLRPVANALESDMKKDRAVFTPPPIDLSD